MLWSFTAWRAFLHTWVVCEWPTAAMVCAKERTTRPTMVNWFLTCYVEIRNAHGRMLLIYRYMWLHMPPRGSHYMENTLISSNSFSFLFFFFRSTLSLYRFLSLHYVINMYMRWFPRNLCHLLFRFERGRTKRNQTEKKNAKNDVHR